MPAKQSENQHDLLHGAFGSRNCCLCRAQEDIEDLERENRDLRERIEILERRLADHDPE
jgi:cell division protein FtsB